MSPQANRSHRRRRHRQGSRAAGRPRSRGRRAQVRDRPPVRLLRLPPPGTTTRDTSRCSPTTGRTRSAATTPSSSAPSVGRKKIPDHVSLWGSLLQFRREFESVHQPAPRPSHARHHRARRAARRRPARTRRDRHAHRAREHGGRVLQHRRPHLRGHRARDRHARDRDVPHRRRPRPQVRLRPGPIAPQAAPHERHQVKRHRHHHAVLGRARR